MSCSRMSSFCWLLMSKGCATLICKLISRMMSSVLHGFRDDFALTVVVAGGFVVDLVVILLDGVVVFLVDVVLAVDFRVVLAGVVVGFLVVKNTRKIR